jgi:hypothetical protein
MGDDPLLFDDFGNSSADDNSERLSVPKQLKKMDLTEKKEEGETEQGKPKRSLFDKILGRKKEEKDKDVQN